MDIEVVQICESINKIPGLRTYASCSGHGIREFQILIKATSIQAIYPLCNALRRVFTEDGKNLTKRWTVELISTDVPHGFEDCPTKPMAVILRTNGIIEDAYNHSILISDYLLKGLK